MKITLFFVFFSFGVKHQRRLLGKQRKHKVKEVGGGNKGRVKIQSLLFQGCQFGRLASHTETIEA